MKQVRTSQHGARSQRGAVGIEFAFLFTIFFGVFYAILSYAFITLLQQGLLQASAEGARAAVQVDRTAFGSIAQYKAACERLARDTVLKNISWMPASAKASITGTSGITFNWVNTNVAIVTGDGVKNVLGVTLTAKVVYTNYAASPMLPLLTLPGLGTIPNVPTDLVGASSVHVTF
ncbi:MAG: hypothetical protein RI920_1268 [Pseudomonadota bacterium]